MCDHHIVDDPRGLKCLRQDPHTTGCVYDGSSVPDAHDVSEAAAEATR